MVKEKIKILSISDVVIDWVYSHNAAERFSDVDIIIGCGDLPYYYLEYMLTVLRAPAFFVRGNHDKMKEYCKTGSKSEPLGATDLHRKVIRWGDLLLAGVEGCLRYRPNPFQYTQVEMWEHVLSLAPRLLLNRLRYGRFLDIFVAHAPPWEIHDEKDRAHNGIKAFTWLLNVFKPALFIHGHIHAYKPGKVTETIYRESKVINTYGYRENLFSTRSKELELLSSYYKATRLE